MNILPPSISEVKRYLAKWEAVEKYVERENSLVKLFKVTYPKNERLDEVLIKVCTLNSLYRTNIFDPFQVAKHIVSLHIDTYLEQNDLQLVSVIAKVPYANKQRNNFVFATKYCSFHKPDVYPIADSFGQKFLKHFMTGCTGWKEYPKYVAIVNRFKKNYGLDEFSFKQIDRYIWQAGKENKEALAHKSEV